MVQLRVLCASLLWIVGLVLQTCMDWGWAKAVGSAVSAVQGSRLSTGHLHLAGSACRGGLMLCTHMAASTLCPCLRWFLPPWECAQAHLSAVVLPNHAPCRVPARCSFMLWTALVCRTSHKCQVHASSHTRPAMQPQPAGHWPCAPCQVLPWLTPPSYTLVDDVNVARR